MKDLERNLKEIAERVRSFERLGWKAKTAILLAAAGLLFFWRGPVHFLNFTALQQETEALDRARALVRLLAASNRQGFSEGREVLFSVDAVAGEPGIREAFITDAEGLILAPVERFGKPLDREKQRYLSESGTGLKVYGLKDSRFFLTYPILAPDDRSRSMKDVKKGVAYLEFDAAASLNRITYRSLEAAQFLILAALGLWGLYLLLKRWTLLPIREASEDPRRWQESSLFSRIEFGELQELLKKCETRGQETDSPQKGEEAPGGIWPRLAAVGLGSYLVLDRQKKVVDIRGAFSEVMGCEAAPGKHLLEIMADSPHLENLLDLILELDRPPQTGEPTAASRRLTESFELKGTLLPSTQGSGYLIALHEKRTEAL